jgi:hypothetical protein
MKKNPENYEVYGIADLDDQTLKSLAKPIMKKKIKKFARMNKHEEVVELLKSNKKKKKKRIRIALSTEW